MDICLTLSYFLVRNYILMARNNDSMTSSKAEAIQGNTPGAIPIESYFLQLQNFLNSTMNGVSKLRQSHGVCNTRDTNKPHKRQGEQSFVIKPFMRDKKERTVEAICTWCHEHYDTCLG